MRAWEPKGIGPLVLIVGLLIGNLQPTASAGSLYSALGLGQSTIFVSSQARGMGGGGVALTDALAINALNPGASVPSPLTRVSVAFMYEGEQLRTQTASGWHNYTAAIAFRFHVPISRKWGVAAGFQPVTLRDFRLRTTGQFLSTSFQTKTEVPYEQTCEGKGGLSALALDVCHVYNERWSVGLGGRFLYGKLKNTWSLDFDRGDFLDTKDEYALHVRGGTLVLGLVARPRSNWSIAAFYQASSNLNVEKRGQSRYAPSDTVSTSKAKYPALWGVGQALRLGKSWLLVTDYWQQDWRDYRWQGNASPLSKKAWRISAGVQFSQVSSQFASFWQKLEPRLGAYREVLSFSPIADYDLVESALTVGLGVPLPEGRGRVDLAVEAGLRGNRTEFPVKERFVRLLVSFVGAEKWFVRVQ